jgi:hypothetical protein
MKQELTCPLCNEKIYSGIGKGCKMCGMPVEDKDEFCSKICRNQYKKIYNLKGGEK